MNAKLTQDELQAIKERHRKAHIGTLGKPIDDTFQQLNDIKKLLAEIERLQAEVHEHSAHNGHLFATHVIPMKEENKRLRKALEFYADKANYGVYTDASNNCPTTNTLMDDGHIAREALK